MARIDLTQETSTRSLGELAAEAAGEISTLVRKEMELARAELREDIAMAGRGAGAFGAAGFTAYLGVLFLSVAAMFGLGEAMPMWGAALVVGGVYALCAAVLAITGKAAFGRMTGLPRTTKTLKEDIEWARHPSS